MSELHDEYELRKQKVNLLRQQGVDPYPATSFRTMRVGAFLERFEDLLKKDERQTLAGRLRLKRLHGKISFAQLEDESGTAQLVFSQPELGETLYAFFRDMMDVGDIVEVTGAPFLTKKAERSLMVVDARILTKAIRPLPDKWHGITDEEARLRKRYVDMLMRPELREMFVKKSRFWNAMRSFLIGEGFLEVETPVLESTAGGADAEPFVTHHNALDIDLYLRISMGELWQKRLMVAGFEKTFEIGRQFRNEGISPEHLQDYTQMEFYWGFADYRDTMKLVERMYKHCIMETFGTLEFTIRGFELNFDQEWPHLDYATEVKNRLGVDIESATLDDLKAACKKQGIEIEKGANRGRLIDQLWKVCRKEIGGPAFLVNHPVDVSPLAKRHPDRQAFVERYQVIIAGSENGNGYSELNDPIDQRARFEEQGKLREAGDAEAQMHDEDFVQALEYGMPPTSGFGVSERLFSFLMDKPIRECVLFPLVRPKKEVEESEAPVVAAADDVTMQAFEAGITREEALKWMEEKVKDVNLRRHMLATEALMRKVAQHVGAVSVEAWGIAGLLHDIDYETCEIKEHSLVGAELLKKHGVHPAIADAVREHNPAHGLVPQTTLSKALMSLEQLTGLVMASAYVQPDKKLSSVKAKSVKKKFKDKSFAAGVVRDHILEAEALVGISLEQAIELCISSMRDIAGDLGLE